MQEQPRFPRESWFPLAAGLLWLWWGVAGGIAPFLLSLLPGVLLVASGGAQLLWPGDPRIPHHAALGGVLGVLLGLPAIFALGLGPALVLMALSAASFVAAGSFAVRLEVPTENVPPAHPSLGLAAQVAADEALLATMGISMPTLGTDETRAIGREVEAARELFQDRGWLEKPDRYHAQPFPLDAPRIRDRSVRVRGGRFPFEHLSFESEYEPHRDEPGRERWLDYAPNRTAHAWVLRHADRAESRPWLVCVHGYQMGSPLIDIAAFDPRYFHQKLGLNLMLPVLPLHGPRKVGRRSGDGFLAGNALDTVHAEAQAMWDIRRLLSWIRSQGGSEIGVHGLSLGGYNCALLACFDEGLRCAIPGVPATDLARLYWRHGPSPQIRFMEHHGMVYDEFAELLTVVSPLALEPAVPHQHRAIFGGVADRVVPPDQVRDLWEHWGQPEVVWYQGAHMTFALAPSVRELVDTTLRTALAF
ncbi:MAG: hypothetical protein O7G30_13950 [Proteobacteria bacterium]|nr:hypothetical protein [Pseudomonadota bacterium]